MGRVVRTLDLGVDGLNVSLHSDSNYWRARVRLQSGKWITKSLKTESEKEATVLAVKLHTELTLNGSSMAKGKGHSFRRLADELIKEIESDPSHNKSEKHYASLITKFTEHFFKDLEIESITNKNIQDYYRWRDTTYGALSKSSLNKHNIALRKVFTRAISKDIPIRIDLRNLENNGSKASPRDAFTLEEIDRIQDHLIATKKTSQNHNERETAEILFDIMEFILCSGVRAGEEYYNVKWGDIQITLENGIPALRVIITKGKTGPRPIIVRTSFIASINQMAKNFPERTKDDYLFRFKDGTRPSKENISRYFTNVLKRLNIRREGESVKTLYSLRHSFITWHLIDGIETFSLTKQCGTSVSMLEKHYEKVKVEDEIARLSGITNISDKSDNEYSATKEASEQYKKNADRLYKELLNNCKERGFP